MIVLEVLLVVYVGIGCLCWLWRALCTFRMIRTVPVLADVEVAEPQRWPRLSVIVPACNEEDTIESAVSSLLAQDYPDLQILLVDDRSSDGTGEVIDRLGERDSRISAIHIAELPEGWLGKVHALHQGLQQADGEFVLFTDADVQFRPGALGRAMAYCVARGLDHVAGIPALWHTNLLVGAMIGTTVRQLNMALRFWAVNDPDSGAYMGIGAFNLVRRRAFDKTEGFAWLRMEVADDVGLGLMMKRSGARCELVNAGALVGLHWYQTVGQMFRGMEKGFSSVGRCSLLRCIMVCLVLLGVEMAPFVALLPLRWGSAPATGWDGAFAAVPWLGLPVPGGAVLVWAALAAFAAFLVSVARAARWVGQPFGASMLAPVGIVLIVVAVLRAAVLGWRRGGVVWRGTFYPAEQLVKGTRVRAFGFRRSRA